MCLANVSSKEAELVKKKLNRMWIRKLLQKLAQVKARIPET